MGDSSNIQGTVSAFSQLYGEVLLSGLHGQAERGLSQEQRAISSLEILPALSSAILHSCGQIWQPWRSREATSPTPVCKCKPRKRRERQVRDRREPGPVHNEAIHIHMGLDWFLDYAPFVYVSNYIRTSLHLHVQINPRKM